MASLFSIMLKTAELLKGMHRGVATGGSTTTLIDTALINIEPDDWFNRGLLFMITGDNANTTISPITDYVKSTGVFSFATITTTIAAGDEYMAARAIVDKGSLVKAVNQALQELGPVLTYSNLTLSEDEQETYVLTGVSNVRRVEVPESTSEPYGWMVHNHWTEINNRIVFDKGHEPMKSPIRVYYMGTHGYVDADDDYVTDYVHPMMIAWAAVKSAMYNRVSINDVDEKWSGNLLQIATAEVENMRKKHPTRSMPKDSHFANW